MIQNVAELEKQGEGDRVVPVLAIEKSKQAAT